MNNAEVKFLVIRFSSIGDIILTSPVVRGIKTQVENSEVHYLTKSSYVDLLSSNPYIDKIHILKSFSQTIEELESERFDYVIDLHNNIRTYRIKNRLKIFDFTFNKLNVKKWLYVNFKINRLPNRHIVDRYLDTVRFFDVKDDAKGLDYFLNKKDQLLPEIQSKLPDTNFIAFGIGGQHFTKRLPMEMIAEICRNIDSPVILLGGNDDENNGSKIAGLSNNVISFCGKISFNQSVFILSKASLVISHDTGIMHAAAALKKNILSVWGNTVPNFGMYPFFAGQKSEMFEVCNLSCRPCSKLGFKKCPKKHFKCMKNQDVKKITVTANKILSEYEQEVS